MALPMNINMSDRPPSKSNLCSTEQNTVINYVIFKYVYKNAITNRLNKKMGKNVKRIDQQNFSP